MGPEAPGLRGFSHRLPGAVGDCSFATAGYTVGDCTQTPGATKPACRRGQPVGRSRGGTVGRSRGAVVWGAPAEGVPVGKGVYRWNGAANTYFWVDPSNDLIGMVWTQYFPYGGQKFDIEFQRLVYQALR